jgi:hypothetical protein
VGMQHGDEGPGRGAEWTGGFGGRCRAGGGGMVVVMLRLVVVVWGMGVG